VDIFAKYLYIEYTFEYFKRQYLQKIIIF